jgi:hypothetical protein
LPSRSKGDSHKNVETRIGLQPSADLRRRRLGLTSQEQRQPQSARPQKTALANGSKLAAEVIAEAEYGRPATGQKEPRLVRPE